MFGYHPSEPVLNESLNLTDLLRESYEEYTLGVQCFNETGRIAILHETSFIKQKFIQMIDAIIYYIKSTYERITALLDVTVRTTESLLKKYEPLLQKMDDKKIESIRYRKVEYNLTNTVPATISLDVITSAMAVMGGKVGSKALKDLKDQIQDNLPLIRAQIMGVNGPVAEGQFDDVLKKVFKPSSAEYETKLTREDLMAQIADLRTYEVAKKAVRSSHRMINSILIDYKAQIGRIYSLEFSSGSYDVTVKPSTNAPFTVNVVEGGMYREYQSVLTNFIMDIVKIYSSVFDAKIAALKEKYERQRDTIRQIIYLIQG